MWQILLQNATANYYKMRQMFITKCVWIFITKCDSFTTNAAVITNCNDFITKCDSYYKMQRLSWSASHPDLHTKKKDIDTKKQFPWNFSKIQDSIFKKPQRKRNKERRIQDLPFSYKYIDLI